MTFASKENIPHVLLYYRHVSVNFAQSLNILGIGESYRAVTVEGLLIL